MKNIIYVSILFCAIALPALGELTPEDLDKIRLIVKGEVKNEISEAEKRIKSHVDIKIESVEKRFNLVIGFISALMLLIVITVGIPQIIIAFRSRKDGDQERRIEELAREIEMLKQQRIINP